jgi:hypothetical protein
MPGRRCTGDCADGTPCRAWAVRGSDPPRCAAHGGTDAAIGAPPGNHNATKHGFYATTDLPPEASIDAIIDNLYTRQMHLDAFIEDYCSGDRISIESLTHLLRIHGQNASRLGRLLRDKRALSGDAADGISGAIAQALDELSSELGTSL